MDFEGKAPSEMLVLTVKSLKTNEKLENVFASGGKGTGNHLNYLFLSKSAPQARFF